MIILIVWNVLSQYYPYVIFNQLMKKNQNNKTHVNTKILSLLEGLPFFAMFSTLNCKITKKFKKEIKYQPFQFTDVETGTCCT